MVRLKLLIIKLIDNIACLFGRGSSLAGFIEQKMHFKILEKINIDDVEVIMVIGTNGKTTTSNMLTTLLEEKRVVISNRLGANMLTGISTILLRNVSLNLKMNCDVIVLEVDEKSLKHIVNYISPTKILVTNFFRDQLDRYGEIDTIIKELVDVIDKTNATIYLNGCDPLIVDKFKMLKNEKVYYGLEQSNKSTYIQNKAVEIKYCPNCLTKLSYDYYHYGHIGKFYCTNCTFKQPLLSSTIQVDYNNKAIIINKQMMQLNVEKFPTYYYFNISAVVAVFKEFEEDYMSYMGQLFDNFEFPVGRNQTFIDENRIIYLNLAKNVVGFEETIDYLNDQFSNCNLLILFNDNYADGRDVSWIWDTQIQGIKNKDIEVYISGQRRYDMAIRFDVEGFSHINVLSAKIKSDVLDVLLKTNKDLVIISNYTPLSSVNVAIKEYFKLKK